MHRQGSLFNKEGSTEIMKRFLKIMATSMCVVMLLGSAIFAANPTSGFGFTFYAGEG